MNEKPEGYAPINGKHALKLLIAKYYREGYEISAETNQREIRRLAEETGLEESFLNFVTVKIFIPAAAAGLSNNGKGRNNPENILAAIREIEKNYPGSVIPEETRDKVEYACYRVLQIEGRSMSVNAVGSRLKELSASTGIVETQIKDLYVFHILKPALETMLGSSVKIETGT